MAGADDTYAQGSNHGPGLAEAGVERQGGLGRAFGIMLGVMGVARRTRSASLRRDAVVDA
jgi:hypothetical protein